MVGAALNSRAIVMVLCALAMTACEEQPTHRQFELNGHTMGTTWSVQLVLPAQQHPPRDLGRRIQATLERINAEMSTYRPDSALSRFNASSSTDWQPVPAELVAVVAEAQHISELSDGAFDITVGPLVNLWGFGPYGPREQPPSATRLRAARARVGYRKLHLRMRPPALRKDIPDLYVDLSAIAKGHAVDRLAALLREAGHANHLVEIGGELRASGLNARHQPWRIAVQRPDAAERSAHVVVTLHNAALATSGDYRNFFLDKGKRYSHTIDPGTGEPVQRSLASVTVLAGTCMRADALATALMAEGTQRGLALAERLGLAALFIERTDQGFRTTTSTAWPTAS